MERIISSLNQLTQINTAYDISTEPIEKLKKTASEAKVCIPIIGKFSSGKSDLVNTILGYKTRVLKVDITPETAIPAELNYTEGNDIVSIVKNNGTIEQMAVEDYRNYDADAKTVSCAKLYLNNSFLKKIPDVMLVDMPGFESGFEIHNKAIDNYLPNSLAYIVAIPADDMTIKQSIGNILKELCLHDMPLCIVITKYDKRNDEFDEAFSYMKESLKKYVGDREITYCITSSFTGDAEELEEFLESIQEQSQEIIAKSLTVSVIAIAENTENYLKTSLENNELSESELSVKEDEMKRSLEKIEYKFSSEKKNFEVELRDCVNEVKQDVKNALDAEESTLVTMILNNQDVRDHLNSVIRNTVTVSVQRKVVTRIEKYIKRVSDCLNSNDICDDINIPINIDTEKLNKKITNSLVAVLTGIFIAPLIGILAGLIMNFLDKKKREEKKAQIRSELRSKTFPSILTEVGQNIEYEIKKIVVEINTVIDNDYNENKNTLLKSLDDLKKQINEEAEKKKMLGINMKEDLQKIEEIKESLN